MKKRQIELISEYFTIVAFTVLFLLVISSFQMLNKSFLSSSSIINMIKTVAPISIAALGLTFVIVIGHSDISFYMSSCFSAMFMAWLIKLGLPPVLAIIGGLIAGVAWGIVSGMAVGVFKLPDIISTIAIGSISFGAAYIFSNGTFIYENFMESGISALSEKTIFSIPLPIYIMGALFLIAYLILENTEYGRGFYAIGSNKKAAFFSGINIAKYIIVAFVISSTLAAVSTMISTAAQGNGNVKIGLNLLMPAFTSIYIGWSIFNRPCVIGTFLGALLTTVMTNGFIVLNIPFYYGDLVIAAVLILSILISKVDISSKIRKINEKLERSEMGEKQFKINKNV